MRINLTILALLSIALFSCNNDKNQNNNEEVVMTVEEQRDILYQEVIEVHDEVMPKMQDIVALQEKIRIQIDSLNEINTTSVKITELREMNLTLQKADDAMMNWMRGFKPEMNAKEVENEVAMAYLDNEMTRIIEVQKVVNASIENAQIFLKKEN